MSESAATYRTVETRAGKGAAGPGMASRYVRRRCTSGAGSYFQAIRGGQNPGIQSGHPVVRESRAGREGRLAESILHAAWRKAGARALTVPGRDGHRYRIIYPGRPADGAGPDFRDAVLKRDDGVKIHGDVEVHVRSGDWHGHGHNVDRAYNGVVLHVALEETGAPVQTSSGMRIPLLLLGRSLVDAGTRADSAAERVPKDGQIAPLPGPPLPFLDMAAAGDEWFRNRVHGAVLQITLSGNDQALWEGALECLGYPKNKKGFRQIAKRLDWASVSNLISRESAMSLLDLFMWAGGFGPRPDGAPQLKGPAPKWSSRPGRPANHPRIRLKAAAVWAARWSTGGGPARVFEGAVRSAGRSIDLRSVFAVPAENGNSSPLGPARAADAVVNLLLPGVRAIALRNGDARLVARASLLFESHPRLQSNSITREASRMLRMRGREAKPRTAREQQGLIHIYRLATASQQPDRQLPLL